MTTKMLQVSLSLVRKKKFFTSFSRIKESLKRDSKTVILFKASLVVFTAECLCRLGGKVKGGGSINARRRFNVVAFSPI